MVERILMAGSGGQGVILMGKMLATVAVNSIEHVTFFPSYGAEVRGGTANCQVVLSTEEIPSPVCEQFESMIVMNQESAKRFEPQMTESCLVIFNRSLCAPPPVPCQAVGVDASEMAVRAGDGRAANFIMLGAFLSKKRLVPADAVEKEIKRTFSMKNAALAKLNLEAFRLGLREASPPVNSKGS